MESIIHVIIIQKMFIILLGNFLIQKANLFPYRFILEFLFFFIFYFSLVFFHDFYSIKFHRFFFFSIRSSSYTNTFDQNETKGFDDSDINTKEYSFEGLLTIDD